jgi:hypothetical protein
MTIVFHIRQPLKRSKSTARYLDRSNRSNGTYCGKPETAYDIPHYSRPLQWTSKQTKIHYVPCKDCCQIKKGLGEKER